MLGKNKKKHLRLVCLQVSVKMTRKRDDFIVKTVNPEQIITIEKVLLNQSGFLGRLLMRLEERSAGGQRRMN